MVVKYITTTIKRIREVNRILLLLRLLHFIGGSTIVTIVDIHKLMKYIAIP